MEIEDIRKVQLKAGDVVVVRLASEASVERRAEMAEGLRGLLPEGVNGVILEKGADLEVLSHADR